MQISRAFSFSPEQTEVVFKYQYNTISNILVQYSNGNIWHSENRPKKQDESDLCELKVIYKERHLQQSSEPSSLGAEDKLITPCSLPALFQLHSSSDLAWLRFPPVPAASLLMADFPRLPGALPSHEVLRPPTPGVYLAIPRQLCT